MFRLIKKYIVPLILILPILSCGQINNIGTIGVEKSKVGFELQDDGHVKAVQNIPSNVERIYFETYLNISSTSDVALEYRWYYADQLIYSYTGRHSKGYALAVLEIDSNKTPSLPKGRYSVEVWFFDTMLDEISFAVQD